MRTLAAFLICAPGWAQYVPPGGGGGGTPGTPLNAVQFNSPLGTFAGTSNFTYDATVGLVERGTNDAKSFNFGPPEASMDPIIQDYTFASNRIKVLNPAFADDGTNGVGIEVEGNNANGDVTGLYVVSLQKHAGRKAYGLEGDGILTGDGGTAYGVAAYAQITGAIAATEMIDFYAFTPALTGGATAVMSASFYSQNMAGTATNPYYSWFDSQGVRRVKEDSTFDSVGQAIEALYNPQFTKYTPGAVNFERVILGRWNGNVAEIGTENGGTGGTCTPDGGFTTWA